MRGRRGGGGRRGGRRGGGGGGGDVVWVGQGGARDGWAVVVILHGEVRGVCERGRSVALVYCWSCGDVSTVETE